MGHYISGDIRYGQLRTFPRFSILANVVGVGRMCVVSYLTCNEEVQPLSATFAEALRVELGPSVRENGPE